MNSLITIISIVLVKKLNFYHEPVSLHFSPGDTTQQDNVNSWQAHMEYQVNLIMMIRSVDSDDGDKVNL